MSPDWQTLTVNELKARRDASIAIGPFGSRMKADRYVQNGVPVIRGSNITDTRALGGQFVAVSEATADELRSANVFADDLVFPHRGAIGLVGIVPRGVEDRYLLSTSLMKLTCNRELVEPLFLFYFFRSKLGRDALLANASTVGTPGIGQPLASLRSIAVRVPSLAEQRAIASMLGAIDDMIEVNRRMSETFEATARAVFKSWFVDFDPVRAKAEGRDPGLSKQVADLFPDAFALTSVGEIPSGWAVGAMPTFFDINPVRSLKKGTVAPYLDMSNMPTSGHTPNEVVARPSGSGTRFVNGDTLLARITPCLENGKTALVDFLQDGQVGWGSTEYIVLRPKPPLPVEFAYCLARNETFRDFAIQSMTGTSGRQRVPVAALSFFALSVPPAPIGAAFGSLVKPLFARASVAMQEASTLVALRNALLPKLVSGEIRIPQGVPPFAADPS